MTPQPIDIGNVYEMSSHQNPLRVVGVHDDVVLYDTWWPHENRWAMAKLGGTYNYYRIERALFEAHARFLRSDPFSDLELTIHRPELPFAFAQRTDLSWYVQGDTTDVHVSTLDAASIYLEPFGPRGSPRPSSLVHAENGRCFTAAEVLRAAHALQTPLLGDVRLTDGVGIYRLGLRKRTPTYYLWGARSRHETEVVNAA